MYKEAGRATSEASGLYTDEELRQPLLHDRQPEEAGGQVRAAAAQGAAAKIDVVLKAEEALDR